MPGSGGALSAMKPKPSVVATCARTLPDSRGTSPAMTMKRRGLSITVHNDDGDCPRRCAPDTKPRSCPIVMAGLGPAIHVFLCSPIARRGWPACACHDDGAELPWFHPGRRILSRILSLTAVARFPTIETVNGRSAPAVHRLKHRGLVDIEGLPRRAAALLFCPMALRPSSFHAQPREPSRRRT